MEMWMLFVCSNNFVYIEEDLDYFTEHFFHYSQGKQEKFSL